MFPERVETDRLELTALTPERVDVLEYYDVCSGNASEDIERITEYLPWEPHQTPKETKEYLDGLASRREAGENAEYAIYPAEDDRIAGVVGLCPHWDRRTGELGIWLRKPFWGRGYYGEAFDALASVAFDRLDLELVEILHRHGNANSRRATEKFVERWDGRYEGRLRNFMTGPGDPVDGHRYTVSKAEFEAAREETTEAVESEETTETAAAEEDGEVSEP